MATGILQLIEEGFLTLETTIDEVFPAVFPGKGVAIGHMLNHTSGLPNFIYSRREFPWDKETTPERILEVVSSHVLSFTPGTKWLYCNTGFLALALVLGAVSGKHYYQYLREHIFEPARMRDTGFIHEKLSHMAKMHVRSVPGPVLSQGHVFGCGDVVTTAHDLLRFRQALSRGVLVGDSLVTVMQRTSHRGYFIDYGYGWFTPTLFGRPVVSHSGSHPTGATAHIEFYPREELVIIVLSNNYVSQALFTFKEMGATVLARELAAAYFGKRLCFLRKMY